MYPKVGYSLPKGEVISHVIARSKPQGAFGSACVLSASWWGNSLPRQRRVAGLRGRPATMALRHGPYTYGWQQLGILDNGRKPDPATPRGGRRPSGCKLLLSRVMRGE